MHSSEQRHGHNHSGGNITLNSGAFVSANGPGDALVLAAQDSFNNQAVPR
jgi:hypothetical protein